MKNMIKKIALALSVCLGVSIINVQQANAQEQGERTNFYLVNSELGNMIYTYDEDGKSYRVEEQISFDMTSSESSVYVKSEDGNYELDYTSSTFVEDGDVNIVTNKDGEISTKIEYINNSNILEPSILKGKSQGDSLIQPLANEIGTGSGATKWNYVGTEKTSSFWELKKKVKVGINEYAQISAVNTIKNQESV